MIDDLYRLQNLIQKKRLSIRAKERLTKDIDAISSRMEKNEYETSGITENFFDVPEKTQQLYKLLETYTRIANIWGKILKTLPIHDFKEVVDICTGLAPKVEIGLIYLNYKGKVIILDKDLDSIKRLIKTIELFNPQFKIISYSYDLFVPLKRKFSFVIGNHILDDIILNYYTNKFGGNIQNIYEKEGELIKVWRKILENEKNNFREVTDKLTRIFISVVKKGGYLCLSQYKSYLERMLNLEKSYKFTKKVFRQLIINLIAGGFVKVNVSNNELGIIILKNG